MDKLAVIEHQGQRVLTTVQLAEQYETTPSRISENFIRNQERYSEGVHYSKLQGEELRGFISSANCGLDPRIPMLYLWTEKGALLHAKSLNTDNAWEVYGYLVDHYFRTREAKPALPRSYSEALRELADTVEAKALLEAKVEADKPKVQFAERVKDATGKHNMKEAAKILDWGPNRLFAHLRDMRIFMSNNTPLQKYIDRGYFVVLENLITINGQDIVKPQTFVTPKGLIWLQSVAPVPSPKGFPGHRSGGGKITGIKLPQKLCLL